MARIRQIHPGQWTDAEFLACSPLARLLALALRGEADDHGIFPWNPLDLKIRLLPADNVSVVDLLGELVTNRQVMRFEADGKPFGAIRNFLKWQRVQRPTFVYPFPDEAAAFVANSARAHGGLTELPPKLDGAFREGSRRDVSEVGCRRYEVGGRQEEEEEYRAPSGPLPPQPEADGAERGEEAAEGLPNGGQPAKAKPMPTAAAFDAWNSICGEAGCRPAKVLNDARRDALSRLLRRYWPDDPLEGWRDYCRTIAGSRFLTGKVAPGAGRDRPFVADFAWAIKPSTVPVVLEGRYTDKAAAKQRGQHDPSLPGFRPAQGTI